ncbi:MAG: ABC transporter permease [Lachnospiraceae bacterium]|nr:ABC transporter permease [Lachnospiraceae bacterium]HAV01502.1 ABC transporter permease [Lachnospiraceae bacterium]
MNKRPLLSGPYLLWILGFTVIPLLIIIKYAFTDRNGAFTLENILAMFEPVHLKAMIFSVEMAFVCTVVCILLSYPLVLALKRLGLGGRSFTIFILILPMWINFILRLLALQMILSNNGVLNLFLSFLGLPEWNVANTRTAIMIGIVYDYLPYMVLAIYNSVDEIDSDIIEAARDLGANGIQVLLRVILPLSVPGLLSGIVMVFVPSMTSFVTANILGGGKEQLIGNVIEEEFMTTMNWNLGSGLSVILMVFVLISMTFTANNETNERESRIW